MSMDDVFLQTRLLLEALENFNDKLQISFQEVETQYDELAPLWADSFRRQHDQIWSPLQSEMKHYLTRNGPVYIEFLSSKIQVLERYLTGG